LFTAALWLGLAFLASVISIRIAISVALIEIVVGAVAGNTIGLQLNDWVNFLAGFGAILLTFLAGSEIDPRVIKKHLGPSLGIGVVSFLAPYLGCLLFARYGLGWSWPQAQIAGIALSTTSVAVVYAVRSRPVSTRPKSERSSSPPASSPILAQSSPSASFSLASISGCFFLAP
jgi:Kef-type K+ transport system membrane component KefB